MASFSKSHLVSAAVVVAVSALLATTGAPTTSAETDVPQVDRQTSVSGPQVVDTISLPGAQPVALAWYAAGNKLLAVDDAGHRLVAIDGSTRAVAWTAPIGGAVTTLVVNETFGKVYLGSDYAFGSGSGLIEVFDADTGAALTRIDPTPENPGRANSFRMRGDEVRDKVYASYFCPMCTSLGVIDVASDGFTVLMDEVVPTFSNGFGVSGVNAVTNEVFAVNSGNLFAIDGATGGVDQIVLGSVLPLWLAVNEVENKVYFFAIGADVQGDLYVLDRDTGTSRWIGTEGQDLEPLVFNSATNTLFAGCQVGTLGAIVDGATDTIGYVDYGGAEVCGMGDGAVRSETDNAYFASTGYTVVVNGSSALAMSLATGHPNEGGVFAMSVVIDQVKGLVYVVNDHHDGVITVIQDAELQLIPPPVPDAPTSVHAVRGDRSARVSWAPASPNGSPITGYTVTGSPGGSTRTVPGDATSATVTGLTNGTAYTFAVVATSAAGDSPPSLPSNQVTPAGVPRRMAAPVVVVRGTRAMVAWTAANPNGAPITRYRLDISTGKDRTLAAGARRTVFKGLDPGRYRVRIAARNAIGLGPHSTWTGFRIRSH